MIRILFVCVQNAGRSQMAEAFARLHGQGWIDAQSAGSRPATRIHSKVIQVMQEKGIDLSGRIPQALSNVQGPVDVVVSMGCGDACPNIKSLRREKWAISDPARQNLERTREIRDEIEHQVLALLERLKSRISHEQHLT